MNAWTDHLLTILLASERTVIAGAAGSGKTTLAKALSTPLAVQHIELDTLYFGPNWTRRPDFREAVEKLAAQDKWITEWQYDEGRPVLLSRAEFMIWIDLPRHIVMLQAIRRAINRRFKRTPLWNGNYEASLLSIFTNRYHTVRWSFRHFHESRNLANRAIASHPTLPTIVVRTRRDANALVAALIQTRQNTEEQT